MEALHAIPTLYGCTISVTGIGLEERQRLAQLIARHGGTFTADLHTGCTHLIVAPTVAGLSRRASPKLAYARKWGLPTVSPDWLYESLSKRTCLEVAVFQMETGPLFSLSQSGSQQAPQYTQNFLYDDLSVEEVGAIPLPPYLEGTHIFVGDQQPSERLALIKKLILAAGGTRHADLYDPALITHYLVHNQTLTGRDLELLRQFKGQHHRPVLVHDQWLFACFHAKERVPVGPFLVPDLERDGKGAGERESRDVASDATLPATLPKATMWSLKPSSSQPQTRAHAHAHGQGHSQASTALNTPATCSRPSDAPSFHLPVFAGITFHLLSFSAIGLAQVTDLIERNGGSILAPAGPRQDADYTIAPLVVDGTIAGLVLNELWLEACVAQGRLLDPLSSHHFAIIVMGGNCTGFDRLRVSLTGYAGLERDYLSRLATTLGASYTENLSKQNNLLLAASDQPGPKYDFAKRMGLPIVSGAWLVDSARAGHPLAMDSHVWSETRGRGQENSVSVNDPNKCLDPQKGTVLLPAPSSTGKRQSGTGVLEMETPVRLEVVKRLKQVAAAATPTGLTQDSGKERPADSLLDRPPDIGRLLSGFIMSISQRLWHRREEMHDLVTEMGGTFVWSYDASCTHYIHQGNMLEESFREFRTVRQAGKWIVSPFWLLHCKGAARKLPETDYPHTFNPMNQEQSAGTADPVAKQAVAPTLLSGPSSPPKADYSLDDFKEAIDVATNNTRFLKKSNISYSHTPLPPRIPPSAAATVEDCVISFSALSGSLRTSLPASLSAAALPSMTVHGTTSAWEPTTTHLLIGALSKSEKFLCACAAGAWVLHPEWGEAATREGKFPPERPYEWHPSGVPTAPSASGAVAVDRLARAPRHWRERRARTGAGAFAGWCVLLLADQRRLPSLRAILRAGGATVYGLGDQQAMAEAPITHVLTSSSQMRAKIPGEVQERLVGSFHSVDLIAEHLIDFGK